MISRKNMPWKTGRIFGFIFSYLIFTSAMFFFTWVIGKKSDVIEIAGITFGIALIGVILKRLIR